MEDHTCNHNAKEMIVLGNIPIPPSSNQQYATVKSRHTGKLIRTKADCLVTYQKEMYDWGMENLRAIHMVRKTFTGKELCVHSIFFLHQSRIYTKEGMPKKFDVSNRIKALHDEIAKLTGIDDCWFFYTSEVKMPIKEDKQECVIMMVHSL